MRVLHVDTGTVWRGGQQQVLSLLDGSRDLGIVQVLLAQRAYHWGYRSVELLLDKIHSDKSSGARDVAQLDRVTRQNVAEYGKNWDKWLGKKP